MIIARRLSGVPALGVVAASLVLTALIYAPVGIIQLPHALPPPQVLVSVAILGVVCTAVAFLAFFAQIAEVGPLRAQAITYVNLRSHLRSALHCSVSRSQWAPLLASC